MRLWVALLLIFALGFISACQSKKTGSAGTTSPVVGTSAPVVGGGDSGTPSGPGTQVPGGPASGGSQGAPSPGSPYQGKKEQLQRLLGSGNLAQAEVVARETLKIAENFPFLLPPGMDGRHRASSALFPPYTGGTTLQKAVLSVSPGAEAEPAPMGPRPLRRRGLFRSSPGKSPQGAASPKGHCIQRHNGPGHGACPAIPEKGGNAVFPHAP